MKLDSQSVSQSVIPMSHLIGMKVYSKVSTLAAWSENCKCYSSLPLCTVVSLFCESV